MAYEIFDDVAFYFMCASILAVFLIPWTIYRIISLISETCENKKVIQHDISSGVCYCAACVHKKQILAGEKTWKRHITVSNIIFVLMWILFLWILWQVPHYKGEQLASFDPHAILGVDKTATDKQVKKAYRTLSLKYHPDKLTPDMDTAEAAKMFLMIGKAYTTLTDPIAKENIEKYGNPDGYQGISMTIGLPNFLTKKENEMRILVVYFIIFIIIPPICVFTWWRQAKNFHESGVLNYTFAFYCHCLTENMGPKALIKLLCLSQEYQNLMRIPFNPQEFKLLYELVKDTMGNVKLKVPDNYPYMQIGNVLIHAYVNRIPIPNTLQPLLYILLKDAHRLLNTIMDIAIARQYLKPVIGCIELMQMLTQAIWIHDSPLKQIPHIDDEMIKNLKKKKIITLGNFKRCEQEKKEKIMDTITPDQWKEINNVVDLLPELDMQYNYEVEDEKDIYEGDIVLVTVELERVKFDPSRPEGEIRKILGEDEEMTSQSNPTPSEPKKLTKKDRINALKNRKTQHGGEKKEGGDAKDVDLDGEDEDDSEEEETNVKTAGDTEKEQEQKADAAAAKSAVVRAEKDAKAEKEKAEKLKNVKTKRSNSTDSTEGDDSDEEDILPDNLFDLIPVQEKKSVGRTDVPPPLAHAVHLPVEKREKWVVFLIEKGIKKPRVVAIQRVPNLVDRTIVELRFPAPSFIKAADSKGTGEAGYWAYELHAMCDSYVGVDQMATFKIKVQSAEKLQKIQQAKKKPEPAPGAPPERDPLDEEEYEGYWYYAGFSSIWELLLNIVVLGLLCVFIFNFLVSRGYWQRYIQPSVDFVGYYTNPIWLNIQPYVAPVLTPLTTAGAATIAWLGDKLYAEPPEPLRKPRSRVNPRTGEVEVEDDTLHNKEREQEKKEEAETAAKMGQGHDEDDEDDDDEDVKPTPTKKPAKETTKEKEEL